MEGYDLKLANKRAVELVQAQPNLIVTRESLMSALRGENLIPDPASMQANEVGQVVFRLKRVNADGNPAKNDGNYYTLGRAAKRPRPPKVAKPRTIKSPANRPGPNNGKIRYIIGTQMADIQNPESVTITLPGGSVITLDKGVTRVIIIGASVLALVIFAYLAFGASIAQALGS